MLEVNFASVDCGHAPPLSLDHHTALHLSHVLSLYQKHEHRSVWRETAELHDGITMLTERSFLCVSQPLGGKSPDAGVSAERRAGGHEGGEEQAAGTALILSGGHYVKWIRHLWGQDVRRRWKLSVWPRKCSEGFIVFFLLVHNNLIVSWLP